MNEIKFVLCSDQKQSDKDRELVAYEIRAHVARHTHSVKQQREYQKQHSTARQLPPGTESGTKSHGLSANHEPILAVVQRPQKLLTAKHDRREVREKYALQHPPRPRAHSSKLLSHRSFNVGNNDEPLLDDSSVPKPLRPLSTIRLESYPALPYNDLMSSEEAWAMIRKLTISLKSGFPTPNPQQESASAAAVLRQGLTQQSFFNALMMSQFDRDAFEGRYEAARPRTRRLALEFHVRTLGFVRHRMTKMHDTGSDELMRSVVSLTLGETLGDHLEVAQEQQYFQAPNQGPLKSLRLLDLYGSRRSAKTLHHLPGLLKMAKDRGGVSNILESGTGHQISNIELIEACRELRRPRVDFVTNLSDANLDSLLEVYDISDHTLNRLGTGFSIIDHFGPSHSKLSSVLRLNLRRLASYTRGVQIAVDSGTLQRSQEILGELRNFVQHELLSTLPAETLIEQLSPAEEPTIWKVVHLAAIIYAYLCVFPMVAAPFQLAAQRIQSLMRNTDPSSVQQKAPELHAWTLFMVGISCPGSVYREWAILLLQPCIAGLGITSWESMKCLLLKHLWLPMTSNQDGQSLWQELQLNDADFATQDVTVR